MKRILAIVTMLTFVFSGTTFAARPAEPFRVTQYQEQLGGGSVPGSWCYEDDRRLYGVAQGFLAAGQSFTITTDKVICSSKVIRAHAQYSKQGSATVTILDYGLHEIQSRTVTTKNISNTYACNTDITAGYPSSELHVNLDPNDIGDNEVLSPVSWTITAQKSGNYTLGFYLTEPWWQGGESDIGFCLVK